MSEPEAEATTPPPADPQLERWTWTWAIAALAWTIFTAIVVNQSPVLLNWLLFSGHARYVVIGVMVSMVIWPVVANHVGERLSRAYLAIVSTAVGLLGALLAYGLTTLSLLTIVALAAFSFAAMVGIATFVPVKLRRPRKAFSFARQIAEITLAGVTLGPALGWLETGLLLLGVAAVLVSVGDDVQAIREDGPKIPRTEIQRAATVQAIELYLSFFRLTLMFAELLRRRRRR